LQRILIKIPLYQNIPEPMVQDIPRKIKLFKLRTFSIEDYLLICNLGLRKIFVII